MTATYEEIDVEDVEDGELDVRDLVCYTWAVGWLGRSSEHSETLISCYQ